MYSIKYQNIHSGWNYNLALVFLLIYILNRIYYLYKITILDIVKFLDWNMGKEMATHSSILA